MRTIRSVLSAQCMLFSLFVCFAAEGHEEMKLPMTMAISFMVFLVFRSETGDLTKFGLTLLNAAMLILVGMIYFPTPCT